MTKINNTKEKTMNKSSGEALLSEPRKKLNYEPEFKAKAVARVVAGESVPKVCKAMGIAAVGTVYGWIDQHRRRSGAVTSGAKSRRPTHQPKLTSQWVVEKILMIKKAKPEM